MNSLAGGLREKAWIVCGLTGLVASHWMDCKEARALNLSAPVSLETAKVLPSGVRNPRFMNMFMPVDSKFNNAGVAEGLGQPMFKTVTWNDVISAQKDETDKSMLRAAIAGANLDPDGSPGTTSGQVNTLFNVKVPVLAMGITERWTLGVAVPIMNVSISADTGFNRSDDGQKFLNQVCNLSVEQCNSAAKRLNNSVNEKLASYGYETVRSREVSGIGDIQMVSKVMLYNNDVHQVALKNSVVFPTGTDANPDQPVDIPTGDSRFQAGATLIYDRYLPYDFRLNGFGGWQMLMPNKMTKRIPLAQNDSVSPDKETLTRNAGHLFSLGTSISHSFSSLGLQAGAGYAVQFLTKTRYSGGTLFPSDRYEFLENLTPSQLMHTATLVAGFSTVEWYKEKKFFYPFQANVTYSHPLIGRSASTGDLLAGELVLFF